MTVYEKNFYKKTSQDYVSHDFYIYFILTMPPLLSKEDYLKEISRSKFFLNSNSIRVLKPMTKYKFLTISTTLDDKNYLIKHINNCKIKMNTLKQRSWKKAP